MTYDRVQEGEEKVQVENEAGELKDFDYVQFDAFFLRDLNGDGYAESIRGTCKEIGKQDTLYMELNVLTKGYLKNGKITINRDRNFYFETAIVKDKEIKQNYIGTNIDVIELNDIKNGTQKLLTGIVKSGNYAYNKAEAIGSNINNYSKINSITLTGTHVEEKEDGTTVETPIQKTVNFNIDWYGTVGCTITNTSQTSRLSNTINEAKGEISLGFNINIKETKEQLKTKTSQIKAEIPELNEYAPIRVEVTNTKVTYEYDGETRILTATSEGTVTEDGTISSYPSNSYNVIVTYPIEAYESLGVDTVQIKIPVQAQYFGYNNPNNEFKNPYPSNIDRTTIVVNYRDPAPTQPSEPSKPVVRPARIDIQVGKYIAHPKSRYIISKEKPLKIYNELSEKEIEDTYIVRWYGYTGTYPAEVGMTFKDGQNITSDKFIKTNQNEESMENVSKTVGIYFTDPRNMLGEDGEIKVYDAETDILLETFTKDNWSKYNNLSPYKFKVGVKHIKVVTSKVIPQSSISIYLLKEIDDEYVTQNYTKEQFNEFQYIKSTLAGYLGEQYLGTDINQALYEAPITEIGLVASHTQMSTQETQKNEIFTIQAKYYENSNEIKWTNGTFLLKLPKEIINVDIKNITIDNPMVQIVSYEQYEENGNIFIKIITENEVEQTYKIKVNCDITPDPRIATTNKQVELYAFNERGTKYNNETQDIYDVNNNLVTTDIIGKASQSLQLISPQSLLTSQTASNYDEKASIAIAPQVANVTKAQRQAKLDISILNNYAGTISEVKVLGIIPSTGNKYIINGEDLESTFSTQLIAESLKLPETLKEKATIYYSENENPSRDLTDSSNKWTTEPEDWSKVKAFLIDMGKYSFARGEEKHITYEIAIPEGVEYNQISYAHHAIFFSLDTENGKYRTQTEPNKIGFRIAKQYDLQVTKYQKETQKKVQEATYYIWEEGEEEGKTKTTSIEGNFILQGLYVERTYCMQEIKSPVEYELNAEIVKFTTREENGNLTAQIIEGNTRRIEVIKEEGKDYKVALDVEDEVKANLTILKLALPKETDEEGNSNESTSSNQSGSSVEGTTANSSDSTANAEENTITKLSENSSNTEESQGSTPLQGIRFKLTGAGLPEKGRNVTTNREGKINIKGLKIGEEYTLEEVKAEGYYLARPIKFTITNNERNYVANITQGTVKTNTTTTENEIPTINLSIENELIPTYNLTIKKVEKGNEENLLSGAKFKLIKDGKELGRYETGKIGTTDEIGQAGIVTIPDLYAFEESRQLEQTYILQETLAPEGFAKLQDIEFKVTKNEDGTYSLSNTQGTIANTQIEGNNITITLADSPSFKLTKTDSETGALLPNTKFVIYNIDEAEVPAKNSKGELIGTKEIIDGKEYNIVITDENGEITADLPQGLYKAVEVQASHDKYILADATYFGIGASREAPEILAAEWAMSIGGLGEEYINSVCATIDGGYIAGGYFKSDAIQVGEYNIKNKRDDGGSDGILIKYSSTGEIEWINSVSGNIDEEITSVAQTDDGGCIVGGYFSTSKIDLGNNVTLTNGTSNLAGKPVKDAMEGMLIKYDSEGRAQWAKTIGGTGSENKEDRITAVTQSSDGDYIIGGNFKSSSIELGNNVCTNAGDYDGIIVKYDREGQVKWATSIGGNKSEKIKAVASTIDGGFIVGGTFTSKNIEVDKYTLTNDKGWELSMLIKYSSNGEVEWTTTIEESQNEINTVVSTDDGGFIVGGKFKYIIKAGDVTLTNASDFYTDGMIIKYDSDGKVQWAKSIDGTKDDTINSIIQINDGSYIAGGEKNYKGQLINYSNDGKVNWQIGIAESGTFEHIKSLTYTKNEELIIAGEFTTSNGMMIIGEHKLYTYSDFDGIMLIKYKNKELLNIVTKLETLIGGNVGSVVATSDGGYILGGDFNGSIQVGSYTLKSAGSYDGMMIKYSNQGKIEWANSIGNNKVDKINSIIQTEDEGYIVVGSSESGSIQVGSYTLKSAGSYDGMIIKYSSQGKVQWATLIGGSGDDRIDSVCSTKDGGFIIGGRFSGRIQIGDYSKTSKGNWDGIVIKYNEEGKVEFATSVGGTGYDYITSVAETKDGGYIVGGSFSSNIQVGAYALTGQGSSNGIVIKYNSENKVEWAKSIEGDRYNYINSVTETIDGDYIVGGYFDSKEIKIGDYTLINANEGKDDGIIVRYNKKGEVKWAKSIGGTQYDTIKTVLSTSDGGYIVGGSLGSTTNIQVGSYILANATSSSKGMVIKYNAENKVEWATSVGEGVSLLVGEGVSSLAVTREGQYLLGGYNTRKIAIEVGVPEQQNVVVKNKIKTFKITTGVEEIDGVKGGTISGEGRSK